MTRTGMFISAIAAVAVLGAFTIYRGSRQSHDGARRGMRLVQVTSAQLSVLDGAGVSVGTNRDAPEVIVVGDFECGFCNLLEREVARPWRQLALEGKVRFRYVHSPLRVHRRGPEATHASYCAVDQGQPWRFHEALYDHVMEWNHGPPAREHFVRIARDIGLDSVRFVQCLQSGDRADRAGRDARAGATLGRPYVPVVIVDGVLLEDATPEEMRQFVSARLRGPAHAAGSE